ncbi:acyl-CoA dehydrogenase family protein [Nocardia sp. alder85J]|uniref:acyl-CoA dehydrogenase family protein n=1 Tax=Nocardia sp. alder85J TaxID=2862949 RepID=UPI001CD39A1B|nr:acyl-CoA dehydrogenase family protein [Nocardia sp. alder85J]MCX4098178.1 acyl-CoA/acyl-ACP dehydrogenase [Nocardia sp. alder85J]
MSSKGLSGVASPPGGSTGEVDRALAAVAEIGPALAARVAAVDGVHPESFADIRSAGLPRLIVPVAHGGGGAGIGEASAVIRALAEYDASVALVLTMHYIHTTRLLSGSATDRVRRTARDLAERDSLLNFAASEGRSGAPSRGGAVRTVATRRPGGWTLTGRKRYVTGSVAVDVLLVTAADAESAAVRTFLVETAGPGVRVEETWDTIGLRGSASHDVVFEDVAVAADAEIDAYDPNTSPARVEAFHNWWSLLLASIHLGIGTAARKFALEFATGERDDGHSGPRSDQARIRSHAGDVELALLQAETLLDAALDRVSPDGSAWPGLGPATKLLVHRHATAAVDSAARLVGGASVWNDSPLSRYYRDLRVALFNPPNDDVVADRIADLLFAPGGGGLLHGPGVRR